MGLFDDDFYSTRISRRSKKAGTDRPKRFKWRSSSWRASRRRKGMSTFQIAAISSLCSAVFAVLLFSLLTGHPSGSSGYAFLNGRSVAHEGDPYERLVQAAAKVRPTVVSIVTHREPVEIEPEEQTEDEGFLEKFTEEFGGEEEFDFEGDFGGKLDEAKLGSGVIFHMKDGKAYVITNNHVIEDANKLEVVTVSGETKPATLVGTDHISDLAVLSIDGKGITEVAELGDSSKLRLGETVIAIGNPLGLGDTLTSGIVSYPNRVIPVSLNQDGIYDWEAEVIQTDAAINEGNSGGALVDLNGRVIGINTMKIADTGVEGLGFAIPVNEVTGVVKELMESGKIVRPYLGVYTVDLSNPYAPLSKKDIKDLKLPKDVKEGVVVLDALGPAKKAGMKLNDVIVKFNGKPIHTTLALRKFLYRETKIGQDLEVTFYRAGKLMSLKVPLVEKPGAEE